MRKLLPLIGILCVLITSCTKEDEKDVSIAVKEIKLSNDKGTIEVGKTIQLTASVLPENATDKTIIFTSSKEDIATVNETGLVSGLTEGQTIISATNGTITENCIITVNAAFIHLTGIDLPNPIISLIEGDTFQLEPVFFPKDASDKTVKYYCNGGDGNVEMSSTGLITALKAGSAEYTIITNDGGIKLEGTIYVEEPSPEGTFIDDRDGKEYKTIKIGEQIWMAENLAYLPSVKEGSYTNSDEECCYVFGYNGTNVEEAKATENYKNLGVLYNWTAAMVIAPKGWHLPSEEEWQQLEMEIGMTATQASQNFQRGPFAAKLKSTEGWASDGKQGTNELGFNGNPCGYKDRSGFFGVEYNTRYWSSTSSISYLANIRALNAYNEEIQRSTGSKYEGYTVRCIKD